MLVNKKSKSFKNIIGITALVIAICAAYFSIFGLSKLFSEAELEVIIMASALELGKLVAISFLYRYWNTIKFKLKLYLTISVIGLMMITSLGIYGFLSHAYQNTANKLVYNEKQVETLENKKQLFEVRVDDLKEEVDNVNNRIDNLNDLRIRQEERIDNLIEGENYYNARTYQNDIERADKEITKLNEKKSNINEKVTQYQDSVTHYEIKMLEEKDQDLAGELGPLIYLKELTGWEMGVVINYFILLIIVVFDPLAISLVIAYNFLLVKIEEEETENEEQEIKTVKEENKEIEDNEEIQEPIQVSNSEEENKDIQKEEEKKINEIEEFERELSKKEFYNEVTGSENKENNNKDLKKNYSNVTKSK